MNFFQADILHPVTQHAQYLHFRRRANSNRLDLITKLNQLADHLFQKQAVVGLGNQFLNFLQVQIDGAKDFPDIASAPIPQHPENFDVWIWLKTDNPSALFDLTRSTSELLEVNFELVKSLPAFRYQEGRDLTGYEDGTENPENEAAIQAAFVQCAGNPLDGSSFVAIQQWQHNFHAFDAMSTLQQNHMIGRQKHDNAELDDAPESAHVKRTAQEDFTPEAFLLRRSMPWMEQNKAGLYFTAFGHSFYAFEAQLRRMLGLEDGIVDALFQISTPIMSSYFWCPPTRDGHLNFDALSTLSSANHHD
ncbi:Dyp-type peroxidase [Undibacterium fentianense]|uniref:Dyp-type peroxidase n=1 Tax=Undibacterium fentianense TaxID=2828728 RepID=A0A941E602_9BURK|nr:Dyp-type peroxidase [Undibacterium fentianense]MBR7801224.1 Dyp-type peroxidase [Undibacterium fentianense]